MGWRFRRTVRLLPGVRLNISRRGVSTTIGVRGASVNIGKTGTYVNLGLPGTGLSYRQKLTPPTPHASNVAPPHSPSTQPSPAQAIAPPASTPAPNPTSSRNRAMRVWGGIGIVALILGALSTAYNGSTGRSTETTSSPATPAAAASTTSAATAPVGSPAETNSPARPLVYVQATAVNIRSDPAISASIVGTAMKGQIFHVFSTSGDWIQVGDAAPLGWVHSALLGHMP